MTHPFRIAFIGIDHPHGSGWRELLSHLGGEVELTAILPGFGGSLTSLEEKWAHLPRFDTIRDLIHLGEFDGAIVCLPNLQTPEIVEKLARAHKHILLEKPGAATEAALEAAATAILESGVAFQSGYLWRYDPAAERLRAMIHEGRFGRLISVEAGLFTSDIRRRGPDHYLFDPRQTGHGGFFHWLMCHYLDLLGYLIPEKIVAVTARVGRFGVTEVAVDDGGTAILELSGGGIVTLTGGYWLPRWTGENHWTIRGSERWVHWNPNHPGTGGELLIRGPQPQFLAMNEVFHLPEDRTTGYGGQRGVRLIRDWVETARTGINHCRNTLESMLNTLRLLDTIYQSSSEGRRIICN
jgi:predicted dehydrogenase